MKKEMYKIIPLLFVFISILGCNKKEDLLKPSASTQANFSYTLTNNGYFPCEATFTNLSLNATTYLWDFGNGLTSSDENPVTTYTEPGLYTVSLTCGSPNDVYYNTLVKTLIINVKDPNAGKTKVLYYTTRGATGGGVYMVILNDQTPQPQSFDASGIARPYGIAVDTANKKVYVTDYENGAIYRWDADGQNMETILDISISGQEQVDYPHGILVLGNKIYWGRTGGIYRANLDGTNIDIFLETSSSTVPEFPLDMAYDDVNQKIYFVNDKYDFSGGIFSINLDGTGLTTIVPDVDATAIELDITNGKIYSAVYALNGSNFTENGIYMMNLDGSSVSKIGDFGVKATWGMALDQQNDYLFWSYKITNYDPDGKIIRSFPDGSSQIDWITGTSPHAMVIVDIKL